MGMTSQSSGQPSVFDAPLPGYLPSAMASPRQTIEAIRDGLPAEAFDWLKSELGLTVGELARVVHVSRRTISRRKKEGTLKPDESERVLRLIRLYQRAAEVLGGRDEARAWMQEPNFALGDDIPFILPTPSRTRAASSSSSGKSSTASSRKRTATEAHRHGSALL